MQKLAPVLSLTHTVTQHILVLAATAMGVRLIIIMDAPIVLELATHMSHAMFSDERWEVAAH